MHDEFDEAIYVLAGRLEVFGDGEPQDAVPGSVPNTTGRKPPASSRPARICSASLGGYSRAGLPTATHPIGIRVSGGTKQPMSGRNAARPARDRR
jgi:hypothetical protein